MAAAHHTAMEIAHREQLAEHIMVENEHRRAAIAMEQEHHAAMQHEHFLREVIPSCCTAAPTALLLSDRPTIAPSNMTPHIYLVVVASLCVVKMKAVGWS